MGNLCSGGTKKDDVKSNAPPTVAPTGPPTNALQPPPISAAPVMDAASAPSATASAVVSPVVAVVEPVKTVENPPSPRAAVTQVAPVVDAPVAVVAQKIEEPAVEPVAVVVPVVEPVAVVPVEVVPVVESVAVVVEPVAVIEPVVETIAPTTANTEPGVDDVILDEPDVIDVPAVAAVVVPVVEVPAIVEQPASELGVYALPAKLHKYVIGQGGKVIKEISATNDVRLDLNGDENKLTITNKENDSSKITAAFEQVKSVLGEIGWFLENGEWVEKLAYDAIFREWSVKIDQEAGLMKKCFDDSKVAFEAGNGEEAKNLSTQGKVHQENMHKYKKDCAQAVFDFLNAKYDDYTMDLHGQLVNEAMEFVTARVEKLTGNATQPLQIITGAGNHSDEKGAKIKPAVFKYLDEKSLKYEEVNNGTISVTL